MHVWLDREVTDSAFVGFIGTQTQWLFNKRRIFEQHGERHPGYLSFVISGARKLVDRSNDELLDIVINDLHTMIPAARNAKVVKALVLKEKHATMAPDPLSDLSRPATRHADSQSFSRRRLDSDRLARHHRERGDLRPRRRARYRVARRQRLSHSRWPPEPRW